jgi:hypothetical protein
VYSRNIKEREMTFGVSGLLYKSNVLFYDHQTESLWSQVKGKAVAGRMTGTPLEVLPSTDRDYSTDPYESYYKRKKGLFSFFTPGPGEKEKQLVAGVKIDSDVKAYPLDILRKKKKITDRLGDREIILTFDPETDVLTIQDTHGKDIPYMTVYWFVWKSIHSDSRLFRLKK